MPKIRKARIAATLVALGAAIGVGEASFTASNIYVVQPGDSLWAIAQRSGVSIGQLAAANHMNLSDVLLIGRHLTIPSASSQAPSSSRSTSQTADSDGDNDGTVASSSQFPPSRGGGDWCATFTPTAGPRGVLPAGLSSSSRLALRSYFVKWGRTYGVQPALLEALAWQESGWQQGVISSDQAVGVGQLLPSTATFVSSQLLGIPLDINSVSDNIRMMARFVAYLESQESGTCRVIAAYYEGVLNMTHYGVLTMSEPYVANVEYLIPGFE